MAVRFESGSVTTLLDRKMLSEPHSLWQAQRPQSSNLNIHQDGTVWTGSVNGWYRERVECGTQVCSRTERLSIKCVSYRNVSYTLLLCLLFTLYFANSWPILPSFPSFSLLLLDQFYLQANQDIPVRVVRDAVDDVLQWNNDENDQGKIHEEEEALTKDQAICPYTSEKKKVLLNVQCCSPDQQNNLWHLLLIPLLPFLADIHTATQILSNNAKRRSTYCKTKAVFLWATSAK